MSPRSRVPRMVIATGNEAYNGGIQSQQIKTYEDRHCIDCKKKISKYNDGKLCYTCHDKRPSNQRPKISLWRDQC